MLTDEPAEELADVQAEPKACNSDACNPGA